MDELEPHRQLLQKLGRMAGIARVLDLNRSDGEFCRQENGKLIYVFDTNVFQMFIQPYSYSRYVELFNTDLWGGDFDRSVNRQAAMISSEHLFGGKLPRPVYDEIIISVWHHDELHEQLMILHEQIKETMQLSEKPKAMDAFHKRLHELAELLRTCDEAQFQREQKNFDSTAKSNDSQLEREGATWPARIKTYAITSICKLLVEDRYTEPMVQLVRLLSGQGANFRPHTDIIALRVEEKALLPASEGWENRLRAADRALRAREVDRARQRLVPGPQSPYRERHTHSLQRDAKTLAWLDVVSTRIPSDQRIVFVTGDRLLLNAYRRRRAETPDAPFTVRSTLHYAPLLNLVDAKSGISGDRPTPDDHFAQMRRAVEQSLAFLNLSAHQEGAAGASDILTGGERDRFIADVEERDGDIMGSPQSTQRAINQKLYPLFFDANWVEGKERELDAIARPFKEVESLAIGAFGDKVLARLEASPTLATIRQWQQDGKTSDLGDALSQAMRGLLQRIDAESMKFALNWAPEFIVTLLGSIPSSSPPKTPERAVYHLRMEFRVSTNNFERIDDYILQLGAAADQGTEKARELLALLRDDHVRLFALATVFAFRHERWRAAATYAELAAEAADLIGDDSLRGEAHYLKATALRYQLSSVAPKADLTPLDRWRRWLTVAERSHDICLNLFSWEDHPIRRLRTFSERAAARLSYAEWGAYGKLSELRENVKDIKAFKEKLSNTYLGAVADLNTCKEMLADMGSSLEQLEVVRRNDMDSIGRHVFSNLPVADLTGRRLANLKLIDAQPNALTEELPLRLLGERPDGQHLIDIIYTMMLQDTVNDETRGIVRPRVSELSLALDRAVAEYFLSRTQPHSERGGSQPVAE